MHGRRMHGVILAGALSLAFAAPAAAAPGDLDSSFGGDGFLESTFGSAAQKGSDRALAAAPASNGGYFIAGVTGGDALVALYEADGDLDPAFGGGDGIATIQGTWSSNGIGFSVDASGRSVVAGGTSDGDFRVVRLTATGAPDATFSGDGSATADFGGWSEEAIAVAHLPDGRIAVAGTTGDPDADPSDDEFGVALFESDGDLDATFSPGGSEGSGRAVTGFGAQDRVRAVAVLPGPPPTLVVAGDSFTGGASDKGDWAVARFEIDGDLDASFAGDGRQTVDFIAADEPNPDVAFAVTGDGSGGLFVAGQASSACGNTDTGVARLTSAGELDASFNAGGTPGKLVINHGGGCSFDRVHSIDVAADGDLVLGGTVSPLGGNDEFLVSRVTSAGAPEASASADLTPGSDMAYGAVADQPADTMLVAGAANQYSSGDVALLRVGAAGSPDTTFSGDGKALTDIPFLADSSETARAVALQPDGKVVVAGPSNVSPLDTNRGDLDFGVARYLPNGAFDPAFGGGDGRASSNFTGGSGSPGSSDEANAVAIQPDGKIVLAGTTDGAVAVARYTAAGVLDDGFGAGGPDGDGLVTVDLGGAEDDRANDVVTLGTPGQPGFRIVVAGAKTDDTFTDGSFALIGLEEDGDPDPDFGGAGVTLTDVGPSNSADTAYAIEPAPGGGLLVAGEVFRDSVLGDPGDLALARYTDEGDLDTSFSPGGTDGDGVTMTDFDPAASGFDSYDTARSMAVRDLGEGEARILLGGLGSTSAGQHPAIAAYTGSGELAPAFGAGGTDGDGLVQLPIDVQSPLTGVAFDSAGLIYATGSMNNTADRFGLLRATADGTPDATFGGDGIVEQASANSDSLDLTVQPDQRVIAVGGNFSPQNGSDFLVARYLTQPDPPVAPQPPAKAEKKKAKKKKCKKKKGKKPKKCKKKKGKKR